jgi:hypothetical protein
VKKMWSPHGHDTAIKGASESSPTVTVIIALVKAEEGGQGHTSGSLLHQSAT